MKSTLSLYWELFSSYSPLKTNKSLLTEYRNITKDYSPVSNIRLKINNLISINYLNESVIKSSFIKRHLSSKSPRSNTIIFELNANDSRADLCVINGKSTVYEIKTEYDTLIRLDGQLEDYSKFFDYLYVIVPKNNINQVLENLKDEIGIIYYEQNRLKNVVFSFYREAKLNENTDPHAQLSSLTKKELQTLNLDTTGDISKEQIVSNLLKKYTKSEVGFLYRNFIKDKYYNKWAFLHENLKNIHILDYQWFYQNNISYDVIYR